MKRDGRDERMETKGILYSTVNIQSGHDYQEQKRDALRESKEEQELKLMKRMLEHMEQVREQDAERLRKQATADVKKKINYHMGKDMARLGRVSQDRFVRSFISGVYARRAQIKGNGGYDSREKAEVLAQMDHVIRCARTKIRQLKEERILKSTQEKLQQRNLERERLRAEQELRTKKTKRMAREQARVFEDMPDLPGLRDRYEQQAIMEEYFNRAGYGTIYYKPGIMHVSGNGDGVQMAGNASRTGADTPVEGICQAGTTIV